MNTMSERDILEYLNSIVQRSLQREEIQQAIARIRERLALDRDLRIAWERRMLPEALGRLERYLRAELTI